MQNSAHPFTRDLVLIGGGHTHALVLRMWGMNPLPGTRVTVINPAPTAPYSGMLPGHVAGHYLRDALEIDLVRLARFAGARVVIGAATGIDRAARLIHVPGRPPVAYDIASIDIGITTDLPDLPGFADHAVPAKPLDAFATAWQAYLSGDGPAEVAVIGGGVAGAELALAMGHALRAKGRAAVIHLVEKGTALSALRPAAARRLRRGLAEAGVCLREQAEVTAVTAEGLALSDGTIHAGFVCGAAGARPHPWLAETGLTHSAGFLTVDPQLRTSDPRVFAAGDCAHMAYAPRPKAGVYAVRQAPVLHRNLLAALRETGPFKTYRPQSDYLKLISLGEKSAMGDRFGLTFSGPWVWRWKDRIDRSFMDKFKRLPKMAAPALPRPRAAGSAELGDKVLCGGCGAKLGQGALNAALGCGLLPGDDAAVIEIGGVNTVLSTDHLREMEADPVVMTRIAAQHALSDIWAMGARPRAAVASVILPRMAPTLAARSLTEIMTAAREVMAEAGAEIVGGHSSQGAELTIGFTVTGICEGAPIRLSGARPGDALILTKPIGSGVVMAAEMAGTARGDEVAAVLEAMQVSQGAAAAVLRGAHAMTDVTGFGLLGHLRNICLNSGTGAEIKLEAVPVLPGALRLAAEGVRSSLYPDNRAPFPDLADTPRHDLLIDPQTSGGLLAAVPGDPAALLAELAAAGYGAVCIGRMTDAAGQIRIV
ncbi:selenide, water dikinase SelD [Maliponia aquimaris]|uniref:Selenide, water dikinase n=1 Tax=Maliponia aquimaris TaxID=1673631 RepID=A0A238KUE2_9RHOB|nr:selenide, water dikinase SelD [Maliponia aquimaris]SMX46211.1 Selenide, water dikinase [Maliponia aquimaris]